MKLVVFRRWRVSEPVVRSCMSPGIVCHSPGGGATMEGDRRRRSLTNSDGITDHVRAREEEHFRKKDRELIEKLRQADAAAKARKALEQETELHDPAMLEELSALGFTPDTIALLPIIPVLQVAWATAGISSAQQQLITNLARARAN